MIYLPDAPIVPATKVQAGSVLGPFPCMDVASAIVALNNAVGASGFLTCTATWDDLPGPSVALTCGSNAAQLFAQLRHVGAFVRYTFTNAAVPTAVGAVTIAHTSRPTHIDGVATPAATGTVVGNWSDTLAALATTSHVLYGTGGSFTTAGYCGPAILSIRSTSVNSQGVAWLVDQTTNLAIGGVTTVGGGNGPASANVVVPPRPCSVTVFNDSANAGITFETALVAA